MELVCNSLIQCVTASFSKIEWHKLWCQGIKRTCEKQKLIGQGYERDCQEEILWNITVIPPC